MCKSENLKDKSLLKYIFKPLKNFIFCLLLWHKVLDYHLKLSGSHGLDSSEKARLEGSGRQGLPQAWL